MTAQLALDYRVERFALASPFRISGHVFTESRIVVVTVSDGVHSGRGEAAGVYYLGDDILAMTAAIDGVRSAVTAGITRDELQRLLPAGGARNAIDCALWEFDARRSGTAVHELAGLPEPRPLRTTFTLGADDPHVMAAGAREFAQARALKLKLTGDLDLDIARVDAVRTDSRAGMGRPARRREAGGFQHDRDRLPVASARAAQGAF